MDENDIKILKRLNEMSRQQRDFSKIEIETESMIRNHFGTLDKTLGIFSRENVDIDIGKGETINSTKLKKILESQLKDVGFRAFTGSIDGDTPLERIMKPFWDKFDYGDAVNAAQQFSRCLAFVPEYAIMLLNPDYQGDMSGIEAEEFLTNNINKKATFGG